MKARIAILAFIFLLPQPLNNSLIWRKTGNRNIAAAGVMAGARGSEVVNSVFFQNSLLSILAYFYEFFLVLTFIEKWYNI